MRRSLLILSLALAACGGRPLTLADAQPDQLAPTTPPRYIGPPADRCVVAIRADDCCCPTAKPMLQSQVVADACLVHVPYRSGENSQCKKRCQSACDCMAPPPSSRVAVPSSDPAQACTFGDECQTSADCVAAMDMRSCCPCPRVVPRQLIEIDPCLSTSYASKARCQPKACDAADCGVCPALSGPRCEPSRGVAGFRICR